MHDSNARSNRTFKTPRAAPLAHKATLVAAPDAAGQAAKPHAHVNLERCRLSLIKGEHRWRFRWEPGCEAAIISAVADLARNPRMNFDWFDAAVVCRHIAHGLPESSGDEAPSPSSSNASGNK